MRWLALVAAFALSSGCMSTESMPTYVVHFTLTNTGGETLDFNYPHCGTARLRDGHVEVDAPRPAGKALVVADPELDWMGHDDPGFSTTGVEADVFGLGPSEVRVPDGVTDSDAAIVVLRLAGNDLLVDGVKRDLPYDGTAVHPDGLWSATYTVSEGPGIVKVDRRQHMCE